METIWHLCPCASEDALSLLIYEITSHLDRAGVSFRVPERTVFSVPLGGEVCHPASRRELGEAIAKIIIKADGKQFVSMTQGEYIDQAVSMGLFPRETDWKSPLTKGDAAVLAAKLKAMLERG